MLYDSVNRCIDLIIETVIWRDALDACLKDFLVEKDLFHGECTTKLMTDYVADRNITDKNIRLAYYSRDEGCVFK